MGMEGNISERRGGKGNLVFGNCVDGSVGGGRSRGKSGPIGGAERDWLNTEISAELEVECKVT